MLASNLTLAYSLCMATNNSTQAYVETAVPRLVNQIHWTMSAFGYSKDEAIAYQRALSVAGPAVWALVIARLEA